MICVTLRQHSLALLWGNKKLKVPDLVYRHTAQAGDRHTAQELSFVDRLIAGLGVGGGCFGGCWGDGWDCLGGGMGGNESGGEQIGTRLVNYWCPSSLGVGKQRQTQRVAAAETRGGEIGTRWQHFFASVDAGPGDRHTVRLVSLCTPPEDPHTVLG